MNIRFFTIIVSYIIYAVIVGTMPVRCRKIAEETGICKFHTKQPSKSAMPVLIFCAVLIAILFIRNLGVFMNSIVCMTALLGTYIMSNVLIFSRKTGIYENGIITSDRFIKFGDIISIPSFGWEDRDDAEFLELVTKDNGTVRVVFSSEEECRTASETIISLQPRLKK